MTCAWREQPAALLEGIVNLLTSNSRRATKPSNHRDLPVGFS